MRNLFYFAAIFAALACSPVESPDDNTDVPKDPADTNKTEQPADTTGTEQEDPKDSLEVEEIDPRDTIQFDTRPGELSGIEVPAEYQDFARVPLTSRKENVQPMTGLVLWSTSDRVETGKENIQLEFSYMLYNDVCKEKDVFDWTPMDKLLEEVAARGHQLVVRFRYTYVGKQCAVPDYIKALPDYEEKEGYSEGRKTYFPDWRCEELQRFHLEFHRRFAERYDNDPRLAFVQTGFGLWAEYHIYDGPKLIGRTFPSHEFQIKFFREMETYFKNTTWSISIDAASGLYAPFVKNPELLDIRFGNFDDSFMHEDHGSYNTDCWLFFGYGRFHTAPCGGEFSYYSDYDQQHCLDKEGMYGRVFEDEVAKFHMTYINANDQPRYQSWERIKEASMSMGYSFAIVDYRVQGDKAAVCIANVGVAPIYRDAYVSVGGVRGDYSLKNLLPNNHKWILIQGSGVSAEAVPQIECDHLVPGQKIEYDAYIE